MKNKLQRRLVLKLELLATYLLCSFAKNLLSFIQHTFKNAVSTRYSTLSMENNPLTFKAQQTRVLLRLQTRPLPPRHSLSI